ncbi:MAG: glycoside hydrolase family 30 beta sandwich domain-containing protein [Methylococcaceae bacterium]|nr:glycoside hydrolase family 30 beta sandwich domain-containing protein [Methylococcaceae bacterium]
MPDETHASIQDFPPLPERCEVGVWLTAADQSALFLQQAPIPFGDATNAHPHIKVDAAWSYQSMDGFGFALTGGSACLINRLPLPDKEALLKQLFLPDGDGIGTSYLRISIGASDLSDRSFSYDDLPPGNMDTELARFDMAAGDDDVIPLLQAILALNPDINIIASPWSAPPWMKTNHGFVGGELKPEFYPVYARYFVKYLQSMNAQGIPIHAISPQNEPLHPGNEPSMVMEAGEQADFIKNHLGPALRDAGLGAVELFCWDHNCDRKDYPLAVLADPQARSFISGVAWHLYAGDISALAEVQTAYPEMKMYFTEQWVEAGGRFADDLRWHLKHVMIGSIRNGSSAVLEWNLASKAHHDPNPDVRHQGPHTPGGCHNCLGALSIADDGIGRNVAYYVIAHAAKFVRPGSRRVFSNVPDALPNVAFKTPGGNIVLIVLNDSREVQPFNIQFDGKFAATALEGGAVGTYVWPSVGPNIIELSCHTGRDRRHPVDRDMTPQFIPSVWIPAIPAGTTNQCLNSTTLSVGPA